MFLCRQAHGCKRAMGTSSSNGSCIVQGVQEFRYVSNTRTSHSNNTNNNNKKNTGLEIQASSVQCEIGKIILKSSPCEPAAALWPLLRALAMCRRLNHRLECAICEMTLAELHLRLGHTHKAETLMKRNLSVLLQQGDSRVRGVALLCVAEIRIRNSSKESASRYLAKALSAFVHAEDVSNVQYVLYLQARLFNDMNLIQERDLASSKWNSVSSHRARAASKSPDSYRFLNTTEQLEKEIEMGNPLKNLMKKK